jgi:hypothetical protein
MNRSTKTNPSNKMQSPRNLAVAMTLLATVTLAACGGETNLPPSPPPGSAPYEIIAGAVYPGGEAAVGCTVLACHQNTTPLAASDTDEVGTTVITSSTQAPFQIAVACGQGSDGGSAWGFVKDVHPTSRLFLGPEISLTAGTLPALVRARFPLNLD